MMKWSGWGAKDKCYDPKKAPSFLDFCVKWIGLNKEKRCEPVDISKVKMPHPIVNSEFLMHVNKIFKPDQVALDNETRLLHAYGKSLRDLFRARSGLIESAPDVVIFPENQEEIVQLVKLSQDLGVKLIPFGGGTNIIGAVEVPQKRTQMFVSVNLCRMNRVLSLDDWSGIAEIEAGVLGPDLERQLNEKGFTLGHFPDSFEFSSLGGWIATRSAGMQSDVYGKIEDMVVSFTAVTPLGVINTPVVPKAATGPDLNQIFIGSEGVFGIFTKAQMKVHRLLPHEYRGVIFPHFKAGLEAIHEMMKARVMPVTTRLSNPDETQLGMAIRSSHSVLKQGIERLFMGYLRNIKGIIPEQQCLMIIGFEGSKKEIAEAKKKTYLILKKWGGVDLGTTVGNKWYAGKYDYPYLRDLCMDYYGFADVTETATTWSKALPLYEHTYKILKDLIKTDHTPGYVGCHISHNYDTGVSLYFTFGKIVHSGNLIEEYWKIKKASVDAVLSQGGALSHHHGIGSEHLSWAKDYFGKVGLATLRGIKTTIDPNEIFNPGKLIP